MPMSKIEIPESKRSFVINNEHADMIVNDLLQGNYEELGKIFTDLVNYNLYGDEAISEYKTDDRTVRTARRLLKSDSENYITNWISRSQQNSKNRTSKQIPERAEIEDYARAKGYDVNIVIGWAIDMSHKDWKDNNDEPIKYWKKALDAYMKGVTKNRLDNMAKNLTRK